MRHLLRLLPLLLPNTIRLNKQKLWSYGYWWLNNRKGKTHRCGRKIARFNTFTTPFNCPIECVLQQISFNPRPIFPTFYNSFIAHQLDSIQIYSTTVNEPIQSHGNSTQLNSTQLDSTQLNWNEYLFERCFEYDWIKFLPSYQIDRKLGSLNWFDNWNKWRNSKANLVAALAQRTRDSTKEKV